ncbi:MAG: tRNA (uridine(54)-C5)-methyltransferase TrmA [Sulfuricurvum sp.]|uniref:tRNA (uridine(54)-C5)-methyltransferase TrmA n=1 Tax=Sulfuricurvum sp. TaxID=2025608 RepID=UPI002609A082|nr:tRNA (uridine(54)-C5)-methyltransferase TrmA [Sulfuricurvum sp.]MDD5159449.1 tRNA (uridine(54)-C5)-methyltransferase TrmA [Sulfuricurvum sp.]
MQCEYFGVCGSCRDYEAGYEGQLNHKVSAVRESFLSLYQGDITICRSPSAQYRSRAEFKIYHDENGMSYAMSRLDRQGALKINHCSIVSVFIAAVMEKLLIEIADLGIAHKLFGVDFLTSGEGEVAVSMLYHRPLDEEWKHKAHEIEKRLGVYIIGRSRKQKLILSQDYVTEKLQINTREYRYIHIENSFTQPNPRVNEQMIEWSLSQLDGIGGDLLELYCGAGNFTIPFATKFDRVLATEISKASIHAAKQNMELNGVENIQFVRLSAEEFTQALDGAREFRRLEGLKVSDYHLKTLFVDPPRAGLGEEPCTFAARFDHLLYISCNPETLLRDLEILTQTHTIVAMAAFDQFPYTHHLEMGVKLTRKGLS